MDPIQSRLNKLLLQCIEEDNASKGNIQLYLPQTDELIIVAHHGFDQAFLTFFSSVKPFDLSSCGRAFGAGKTIFIGDTRTEISFIESHRRAAEAAGFRAVKSMPVFCPDNKPIGVVSTHFSEPRLFWEIKEHRRILSEIAIQLAELAKLNHISS